MSPFPTANCESSSILRRQCEVEIRAPNVGLALALITLERGDPEGDPGGVEWKTDTCWICGFEQVFSATGSAGGAVRLRGCPPRWLTTSCRVPSDADVSGRGAARFDSPSTPPSILSVALAPSRGARQVLLEHAWVAGRNAQQSQGRTIGVTAVLFPVCVACGPRCPERRRRPPGSDQQSYVRR